MKKKIALLFTIAVVVSGIFIFSLKDEKENPQNKIILTEYQIEPYLNLRGWEVALLNKEKIRVPINFSDNFQKLADESEKSGLTLNQHKGSEVTRYTYQIHNNNYSNVIAELLITNENELISAVLIEQKPDGFIKAI